MIAEENYWNMNCIFVDNKEVFKSRTQYRDTDEAVEDLNVKKYRIRLSSTPFSLGLLNNWCGG